MSGGERPEPGLTQIIAYALPALPLAALTLPLYIFVPTFYATNLALPLASVGAALLLVRVIDALSDPVLGVLVDRWRPAFGRRRLWFACACVPAAGAAWFVFVPPTGAGLAYLVIFGTLVSVAWTATTVAYTAWGAEMSTTYDGRTRVTAYRETIAVFGTLIALSAQSLVPLAGFAGQANVLKALAYLALFGVPIAVLVCVIVVHEPKDATLVPVSFRAGLPYLAANQPFQRLLLAFFLNGCANGFPATLFLFFVTDRLQAGAQAGPLLFLYFLCGIIGVPFWLWLARVSSKHRAWSLGMVLACGFFGVAPFLGAGQTIAFAGVCIGTGFALGADLLLPPAIQADVIDVDTARSGAQRAGLYFAIWGFATKLALALAVGLAFPVLAAAGFDPVGHNSTTRGLMTLGLLYAALPIVLKLIAARLIWNFPIDATAQASLRAQIDAQALRAADPVPAPTSAK